MQWNGIRIPVVFLALLVGMGALWGAQWTFKRYNYERPLTRILGENTEVASYKVNDQGSVLEIEVKLRNVDNIQDSYNGISQSVQQVVGRRNTKLTIKDERNATLEGIYYHTRLAAYEAMERGNYLEMENYIVRRADRDGASARVFMDGERMYIQIKHKDSYLYEIIPRAGENGAAYSEGGEGRRVS